MTILVTGATGCVGGSLVKQLLAAGESVRALTRRPDTATLPDGAEPAGGDLTEPDSLAAALRGVDRMFLFPVPETAHQVVRVAVEAGVGRIVVLSAAALEPPFHRPYNRESAEHHAVVERAVEAAGVEWTHLRPAAFATNTLSWVSRIPADGVVALAYPRAAQALIHEADIAAVAATALRQDGHHGARYPLTGPVAVSQVEQVAIVGAALGRELTVRELDAEEVRARMPASVSGLVLGYLADAVEEPDTPVSTVEDVTGRPARTYAQWVDDHRQVLR